MMRRMNPLMALPTRPPIEPRLTRGQFAPLTINITGGVPGSQDLPGGFAAGSDLQNVVASDDWGPLGMQPEAVPESPASGIAEDPETHGSRDDQGEPEARDHDGQAENGRTDIAHRECAWASKAGEKQDECRRFKEATPHERCDTQGGNPGAVSHAKPPIIPEGHSHAASEDRETWLGSPGDVNSQVPL